MRDIKLILKGDNSTIDLTSSVSGKSNNEQKCLVNLVTENGSDTLYPDRGTTLLIDSINCLAYDRIEATHIANFAALDTEFFVNGVAYTTDDVEYDDDEEIPEIENPDSIWEINLNPVAIDAYRGIMDMTVKIKFVDETETEDIASVPLKL